MPEFIFDFVSRRIKPVRHSWKPVSHMPRRCRACAGRCRPAVVAALTADPLELFFDIVARRGAAQPGPDQVTSATLASRVAAIEAHVKCSDEQQREPVCRAGAIVAGRRVERLWHE